MYLRFECLFLEVTEFVVEFHLEKFQSLNINNKMEKGLYNIILHSTKSSNKCKADMSY